MNLIIQFVLILIATEKVVISIVPPGRILQYNTSGNVGSNSTSLNTYSSSEPSPHQFIVPSLATLIPTIILFNPRDYSPTPTAEPTASFEPTSLSTSSATTSNTFANTINSTAASTPIITTLATVANTWSAMTDTNATIVMQLSTIPTSSFTSAPSYDASTFPTSLQSLTPSSTQTFTPSSSPSTEPTLSFSPTPKYKSSTDSSNLPTTLPTKYPSHKPSHMPMTKPSHSPSIKPTRQLSRSPSILPTKDPSNAPSLGPTIIPSIPPSVNPTINPSITPSINPTINPSANPSNCQSSKPSKFPSYTPSFRPSFKPTLIPSGSPTVKIHTDQNNNRSSYDAFSQTAYIGIIIACGVLVCFSCTYCIYRKVHSNGETRKKKDKYSQLPQSSTKGFWNSNSNLNVKENSIKGMMPPTVPNETYENDMYGRHRGSTMSRVTVVHADFDGSASTFGAESNNERQSYFIRSSMINAARASINSKMYTSHNFIVSDSINEGVSAATHGRMSRGNSVDNIDWSQNVFVKVRASIPRGNSVDNTEPRPNGSVDELGTGSVDSKPKQSNSNGLIANNPLSRSTVRSRATSQVILAGSTNFYDRKRRFSSDADFKNVDSDNTAHTRKHLYLVGEYQGDEMISVNTNSTYSDNMTTTDDISSAGFSPQCTYGEVSSEAIDALSPKVDRNQGITSADQIVSSQQGIMSEIEKIQNTPNTKCSSFNHGYPQALIADLKHQLVSRNYVIENIRKTLPATGDAIERVALTGTSSYSISSGSAKSISQQDHNTQDNSKMQLLPQDGVSHCSQGELELRQESSSIHSLNSEFDPFAIEKLSSRELTNGIEFQTLNDKNREKILLGNIEGTRASGSDSGSINRDSFVVNQFAYDTESEINTSTERGSIYN